MDYKEAITRRESRLKQEEIADRHARKVFKHLVWNSLGWSVTIGVTKGIALADSAFMNIASKYFRFMWETPYLFLRGKVTDDLAFIVILLSLTLIAGKIWGIKNPGPIAKVIKWGPTFLLYIPAITIHLFLKY